MRVKLFGLVGVFIFVLLAVLSHANYPAVILQDKIRNRIEVAGVPPRISVGEEVIHAAIALPTFYEQRAYHAAWVNEKGPLSQATSLLKAIQSAGEHGLRSADYHWDKIEQLFSQIRQTRKIFKPVNPRLLVDLDLLLTDAFLIYGSHLAAGRINPERIDPQWFVSRRDADLVQVLEEGLRSTNIEEALISLLPQHADYERLRQRLALYRKISAKGGWPYVPEKSGLQKGDQGDHISILRQRLSVEGFIEEPTSVADSLFDDRLEEALKKFQIQNGLEPDGVLGPQTIKTLNITVDERIRQIVVNMERWRWLPQDLGTRYILVNIAGFYLYVIENQKPVMNMRVVTGKPYRRTPVFSDKITYLVMNPFWAVPRTIAEKDILPKVKKDPAFLIKQNFKIFQGWGTDAKELNAGTIDWQTVTAANLGFRFRQDPGPQNALGRIKFMFPNQFDVYLHDTPSRELFAKARRDFSSGCIRIEKPIELAEYLLRSDPDWPPEKIRQALTGTEIVDKTIKLPEPVNIHILYWTVWIGKDELLHFSPDIYDRDKALDAAMQEPPPGA